MNETIAVIVTYNRKKLLQECVDALLNQTIKCDILIIDNNSIDGTEDFVKSIISNEDKSSKIFYHNTRKNIGGAGGFSLGVKKGTLYGYKYLWIMDDDCIVEKEALEELFKVRDKHYGEFGFLASNVIYDDGEICLLNTPRQGMYKKRYFLDEEEYICDRASFTSILVPSAVVRDIGLPIRDFFIWGDDLEYTRRISKKYCCYACMKSIAVHKPTNKRSCDIASDDGERLDRYQYVYRNDVYIYKREGVLGLIYILFRDIKHIIKCLFSQSKNKIEKCKIIISSTWKGLFFNPSVEMVE